MPSNPPQGISAEFIAGHVPGQYRRFPVSASLAPGAATEWVVTATCGCGHKLRATTTQELRNAWADHLLSAMLDVS